MIIKEHNRIAYERIKEGFKRSNKVATVCATGTGKSYQALQLIEDNTDKQILYITSLKTVKEQFRALCKQELSYETSALKSLGQVVSAMSSPFYEEVLEEELADKTDVNALYLITKYKFELYNDEYRFRLFVLNHREMFPISLEVDEGITEDIQYKNGSPISGNDELKNILREIFSSYKVHSVVSKMLQKVE